MNGKNDSNRPTFVNLGNRSGKGGRISAGEDAGVDGGAFLGHVSEVLLQGSVVAFLQEPCNT